jgi:hypothetical protein
MNRPLLYLAAPYTRPDPIENTHRIAKVATIVYEQTDWVPFVPHLSMLWHTITPRPIDFWYSYDIHVLRRCNGFVRLPGESTGADVETKIALELEDIAIVDYYALPYQARMAWGEVLY